MGLDNFKYGDDSDDSTDNDEQSEDTINNEDDISPTDKEQAQTAIDYVGVKMIDRIEDKQHNIQVDENKVIADVDELARLFAVMTMDFGNADFDELMDEE